MPVAPDPTFASYAHPDRLVTTEWLSANIGAAGLKILECDTNTRLYDIGHIPGASKLDWHADLDDPVTRDCIDGIRFAELMRSKGIERDDTIVLYGDHANTRAAHALWVFTLFGHADVRLLDGGREAWIDESRETTFDSPCPPPGRYPQVRRDDHTNRIFREEVLHRLGVDPLIDVRSPAEYAGIRVGAPTDREEMIPRGGHIPGAVNLPWNDAIGPDGRFRDRAALEAIYDDLTTAGPLVVYSGTGERASHTWFVLKYLLGVDSVRNYDGSWTEWGNTVRMPIALFDGAVPAVAGAPS